MIKIWPLLFVYGKGKAFISVDVIHGQSKAKLNGSRDKKVIFVKIRWSIKNSNGAGNRASKHKKRINSILETYFFFF